MTLSSKHVVDNAIHKGGQLFNKADHSAEGRQAKQVEGRSSRPKAVRRSRSSIHPEGLPNARSSPGRRVGATTGRSRWTAIVRHNLQLIH